MSPWQPNHQVQTTLEQSDFEENQKKWFQCMLLGADNEELISLMTYLAHLTKQGLLACGSFQDEQRAEDAGFTMTFQLLSSLWDKRITVHPVETSEETSFRVDILCPEREP